MATIDETLIKILGPDEMTTAEVQAAMWIHGWEREQTRSALKRGYATGWIAKRTVGKGIRRRAYWRMLITRQGEQGWGYARQEPDWDEGGECCHD